MILSRRVALGGIQLDQQDAAVVIRHVDPGVPHESIGATNRMGIGSRLTSQHWETLDCSVSFAINLPKKSLASRRQVFDKVVAWAMKKGWLTTNEMPSKRMYVNKVIIPDGGDMWEWTKEYTIVFRAYDVPFWQDATATPVTKTLTGGTMSTFTMTATGNVTSVIDLTFTNTSGSTVNTFEIVVGGKIMSLSDINLGNGKTLTINHGTDGILRIDSDGTSVYNKQAANGADDLYVEPGDNAIAVTAGGAGTLSASIYGRYL